MLKIKNNKSIILLAFCITVACVCCKEKEEQEIVSEKLPDKVCLNKEALLLYVGEEEILTVTINPDNFDKNFIWASSDTSVADVDCNGRVVAKKTGSSTISVLWDGQESYLSKCKVTVSEPEAVDLGLSVAWASFNMGASKIEEFGDCYAWGEILSKTDGNWGNYIWCEGTEKTLTKYCTDPAYGKYDNKRILEPSDDVANVRWRGEWRIPTAEEIKELKKNCNFEWTYLNGVNGIKATSKVEGYTNRFIFFPIGMNRNTISFWSSSQSYLDQNNAILFISQDSSPTTTSHSPKDQLCSIRPVSVEVIKPSSIKFNYSSIKLFTGISREVSVEFSPENSSDRYLAWISSDPSIAEVDNKGTVTAKRRGEATITAYWMGDSNINTTCIVTIEDVPTAETIVDLGLSVKWGSCNLGASSPTDYGGYYAWGETEEKDVYNEQTYKWCNGSYDSITKYCSRSDRGSVDNKIILDLEDDVAYAILGDKWRIPTYVEWSELVENCVWSVQVIDNEEYAMARSAVKGYENNFIILPAAGHRIDDRLSTKYWTSSHASLGWFYGFYWTSSKSKVEDLYPCCALFGENIYVDHGLLNRFEGLSIRPVYDDESVVTEAILDQDHLDMNIGDIVFLEAKTTPRTGEDMIFTWESSSPDIAEVTDDGYVIARKPGSASITASWKQDPGIRAKCSVLVSSNFIEEAVDLGLSVQWASYNIGAKKAEDYGVYFAWGETEPKEEYTWDNYLWCNGQENYYTKYNTDSSFGIVDDKTTLDSEDDAAKAIWGGDWRMPTKKEMQELLDNCSREWVTINGVEGCRFSGNNNSIFLPASGYMDDKSIVDNNRVCKYWSSMLNNPYRAASLNSSNYIIVSPDNTFLNNVREDNKYSGLPIRPVKAAKLASSVSLDQTSIEMNIGTIEKLNAKTVPGTGINMRFDWKSSNPNVAYVTNTGYVIAKGSGSAVITASWKNDNSINAICSVSVSSTVSYEPVDLGLSVKWASVNLGASKQEEDGAYFAWGETEPKEEYTWGNYLWCKGSMNTLTKYCTNPSYGYVDNKTILELEDDAARTIWGGKWRIPSQLEITELIDNCEWEWTAINGVYGYKVSRNNNSIFLPAAGYFWEDTKCQEFGNYWSSNTDREYAYKLKLQSSDSYFVKILSHENRRYIGLSIRPVSE